MPNAWNLIREAPWYRAKVFSEGLRLAGFLVQNGEPRGRPGDVLLIWNRYAHWHEIATKFEAQGGTVVVAENGYLGFGGSSPKFDVHPGGPQPHHYYALGVGFHNGRGVCPVGGPDRFQALGVELKPWRSAGEHILVCPNRSFGVGKQVMDKGWVERCLERLRCATTRPVRVRDHPGNDRPRRSVQEDLEGAWAVIVWSSSVAQHALAAGIPTFIEAPWQIMKGAGAGGTFDHPVMTERLPHFERMAWAQFRLDEIESGEPFRKLLC